MEKDQPTSTSVREVSSDGSKENAGRPAGDILPMTWPAEPQHLKPSKASKILNNAFDALLFIAPLALLVKCGLIIWAAHRDAGHTGEVGSPPSKLTAYLIRFNGQVGFKEISLTSRTTNTELACYHSHHYIRHQYRHPAETFRPLEGSERGCRLDSGTVPSQRQFT
jgi:hypothetical protein